MDHLDLGAWGERKAASLLRRKGFHILERNYRCSCGELDIIARRGRLLVFCEVKTRSSDEFAPPFESVDRGKMLRLGRAADAWLARRREPSEECRFDLVTLVKGDKGWKLEHIPDAFQPDAGD